jgi:hypothetical protein
MFFVFMLGTVKVQESIRIKSGIARIVNVER